MVRIYYEKDEKGMRQAFVPSIHQSIHAVLLFNFTDLRQMSQDFFAFIHGTLMVIHMHFR